MRTQSSDTSPEVEKVQIEMLRKAPLTKRFAMVESWSRFIVEVAKQGIRRDYPDASEEEVSLLLVERQYGQDLANRVRAYLDKRKCPYSMRNVETTPENSSYPTILVTPLEDT